MTSLRRVTSRKFALSPRTWLLLALTAAVLMICAVLLSRLRGRGGVPTTEGGWRAEPLPQLVSAGGPELSPN